MLMHVAGALSLRQGLSCGKGNHFLVSLFVYVHGLLTKVRPSALTFVISGQTFIGPTSAEEPAQRIVQSMAITRHQTIAIYCYNIALCHHDVTDGIYNTYMQSSFQSLGIL